MTENTGKPVTVESALEAIVRLSNDASLSEKSLRLQVWGFAKAALEQIAAAKTGRTDPTVVEDGRTVAWLLVWADDTREVRTKPEQDRYGLARQEPLTLVPNGEIVAWRWADGGGYNADHRYSFIDPLEDPEEVEAQNASSVIGCRPLYLAATTS